MRLTPQRRAIGGWGGPVVERYFSAAEAIAEVSRRHPEIYPLTTANPASDDSEGWAMAGIQDPNVVDLVGQAADGTYLVIMVEERPWGSDPDQPRQLQEKINAYASFVLDGTLAKQYPETAGQRIRIQLNCPQQPDDEVSAVTGHAAVQLEKLGIGFAVRVLP